MDNAREVFTRARADYLAYGPTLEALQVELDAKIRELVLEEIAKLPPTRKRKAPPEGRDEFYKWARTWLGPQVGIWYDGIGAAIKEKANVAYAERERNRDLMAEAALFAVWERVPGAETVVYVSGRHAFASQGNGAAMYMEAACKLRLAVLQARGFAAHIRMTSDFGVDQLDVVADCDVEVAAALKFWRLDDQRLLDVTHPANLKVVFGGMFPFAGSWDWPKEKRETRESESFRLQRENEDAHTRVNHA